LIDIANSSEVFFELCDIENNVGADLVSIYLSENVKFEEYSLRPNELKSLHNEFSEKPDWGN
jgi:hypothetical protein